MNIGNWCEPITDIHNEIQYDTYNNHIRTGITKITIGPGVETIEENAFKEFTGLKTLEIHNGVKEIKEDAFRSCRGLTSIVIPNSVTYLSGFSYCTRLDTISIGNSVSEIGDSAFASCVKLTTIPIPNSVTSIGKAAFSGCKNLTSIEIPDSVISIGQSAFANCTSLISIAIPNSVTTIGNKAFSGCTGLTSLTIPNSVTIICYEAFMNCTNLKSVIIGNSVTSIGGAAFNGCTGLTSVKALNPTPVSIAQDVFTNRKNATLYVPKGSEKAYQVASYWKEFKEIKNIPLPTHKLIYMVDGEKYKSYDVEEGESIIPEKEPTKKGYTFSGWSEVPENMPANDVIITGTFSVNSYTLTYKVDGEVYRTSTVAYGTTLTPENAPTKEGYTFSGWSDIPATMPANDVVVTGTFKVNTYAVTFMYNDIVLKVDSVEYGVTIPLPTSLNSERYSLIEWLDVPETMPAHDITIYASVVDGILTLTDEVDYKIYNERGLRISRLQRGINIIKYSNGRIRKVIVK